MSPTGANSLESAMQPPSSERLNSPASDRSTGEEPGAKRTVAIGPTSSRQGKSRPNHQRTMQALRSLTPEQKLRQVFQLNERMLALFRLGLRQRFPELDDRALEVVYLQLRRRCHSRNY